MFDIAAHLVDEVLPKVPIRQWVCSLPWRLRYAMVLARVHRRCDARFAAERSEIWVPLLDPSDRHKAAMASPCLSRGRPEEDDGKKR